MRSPARTATNPITAGLQNATESVTTIRQMTGPIAAATPMAIKSIVAVIAMAKQARARAYNRKASLTLRICRISAHVGTAPATVLDAA